MTSLDPLFSVLISMTHSYLCSAAVRWLEGTKRCNVALSGIASTREIPDAIGWSTSGRQYGSIVVECKVSVSDFHANKHKDHGNRLGQWRYFLVPDGLVPIAKVCDNYPGHGLLYLRRGRVSIIHEATQSDALHIDLHSEIRLLQFALVHVRENLLRMRCAVDMNTLTKSSITNDKANGFSRCHDIGYGVDFPLPDFSFVRGECR